MKKALLLILICASSSVRAQDVQTENVSKVNWVTIEALIIAVISCEHSPTARTEKARLRNSFLTVAGIFEALIKARITDRFSRVTTTENTKSKTHKERREDLL